MNQHHADMLVHKSLLEVTAESSKEHNISPQKMLKMLLSSHSFNQFDHDLDPWILERYPIFFHHDKMKNNKH